MTANFPSEDSFQIRNEDLQEALKLVRDGHYDPYINRKEAYFILSNSRDFLYEEWKKTERYRLALEKSAKVEVRIKLIGHILCAATALILPTINWPTLSEEYDVNQKILISAFFAMGAWFIVFISTTFLSAFLSDRIFVRERGEPLKLAEKYQSFLKEKSERRRKDKIVTLEVKHRLWEE